MGREAETAIGRARRLAAQCGVLSLSAFIACGFASAQTTPALSSSQSEAQQPAASSASPIAIVPLAGRNGAQAPTVTGALEVTGGKAIIGASGAVTSGDAMTAVTLPGRGVLQVCAGTTVKLAADTSVPKGETPGLLMAMDHGAMEATLQTGPNADIVLTPDFRILIGAPGTANLRVRLGRNGDTCVDNAGANAPYVVVTSLFDSGIYRAQPGQRVLFEHGSLSEVVDNEKEPCGCPAPEKGSNAFPAAESEGLAPLPKPAPAPPAQNGAPVPATAPLVYNSAQHAPKPAPVAQPAAPVATAAAAPSNSAQKLPARKKKPGFFTRIGRFFKRIFGAD